MSLSKTLASVTALLQTTQLSKHVVSLSKTLASVTVLAETLDLDTNLFLIRLIFNAFNVAFFTFFFIFMSSFIFCCAIFHILCAYSFILSLYSHSTNLLLLPILIGGLFVYWSSDYGVNAEIWIQRLKIRCSAV